MQAQVQWLTASPLWHEAADSSNKMRQPALLCFKSDVFMDELFGVLQSRQPERLALNEAQAESFRARPIGETRDWKAPPPAQLKLYQPVHGHFALVAATLVCRTVGLPDRAVDAGAEKVGFVLRKVGADEQEQAWVFDPTRPEQGKVWQPVARGQSIADNEEIHPLFPITYLENGRKRRLFAGLIPTASRDTLQAGKTLTALPSDPTFHPLEDEIDTRIVQQLQALRAATVSGDTPEAVAAQQQALVDASIFLLLDFADFLNTNLPALWRAIDQKTALNAPPATTAELSVYNNLGTAWRKALNDVWEQRAILSGESSAPLTLKVEDYDVRTLPAIDPRPWLVAAINAVKANGYTPPTEVDLPKLEQSPGVLYRLRCVYRRPCGALVEDVVSEPSRPFAIAGFFDFDAPARSIRIEMPVDTSPGGLRKFNKNVAFLISDKLRQQMESVTNAKETLKGNLESGQSFDLGVICSFSIPIITICALIVLMIFINLLNIVFWWLPLLRICLPINLKAKA